MALASDYCCTVFIVYAPDFKARAANRIIKTNLSAVNQYTCRSLQIGVLTEVAFRPFNKSMRTCVFIKPHENS